MPDVRAAALLVLVLGGNAIADDATVLRPGSRVRITASTLDAPVRGTLTSLGDHTLTLETRGRPDPLVIERSRITSLDVSAGRRSRGRRRRYRDTT